MGGVAGGLVVSAAAKSAAPARLTPIFVGQVFVPWGTDSQGVVEAWRSGSVSFHYVHEPGVSWSMGVREFTDRFARWAE